MRVEQFKKSMVHTLQRKKLRKKKMEFLPQVNNWQY